MSFRHMQGQTEFQCPQERCHGCPSLTAVLHAVPNLLELMPSDAKLALANTSKSMQRQVCASATSIRLISLRGLDDLFNLGIALHLRALTLHGLNLQCHHAQTLACANLPCLASLGLSKTCLDCGPIVMLAAANWPLMTELDISHNGLLPDACKAMATLSLPRLVKVNLSSNWLDTATLHQLIKAEWPMLESVELKGNHLSLKALHQLVMAKWPCLVELTVSGSFSLASLIGMIRIKWPTLKRLHVECAHIHVYDLNIMLAFPELQDLQIVSEQHRGSPPYEIKRLAHGAQWSKLQTLDLQSHNVPAMLLLESNAMHWPELHTLKLKDFDWNDASLMLPAVNATLWLQLSSLTLSHNQLTPANIQWLCLAEWPKLQELDLSDNCLGVTLDPLLGRTARRWPELQMLNLSCNSLTDQAVLFLVDYSTDASWSKLKSLHLQSCRGPFLRVGTVEEILRGRWPKLTELQLSVCSSDIAATAGACGASACWEGQLGMHLVNRDNQIGCWPCPCSKSILLHEDDH